MFRKNPALHFNRAAKSYAHAAILPNAVGQQLLSRLAHLPYQPKVVCDLGCGPGSFLPDLQQCFPLSVVVGIDYAEQMLKQSTMCHANRVAADAHAIPLADNSVDLVFSNLLMHWCDDLVLVFSEILRVLKPGGQVLFSACGIGTLHELNAAYQSTSDSPHVNHFLELQQVGDLLKTTGFLNPVVDHTTLQIHYHSVQGLLKDLKRQGVVNTSEDRARGLQGKSQFKAMMRAYEAMRDDNQLLPASYEIIFGFGLASRAAPEQKTPAFRMSPDALKKTMGTTC